MAQFLTLDDVLDLFVGDGGPLTRERLQEFVLRYPEFRADLVSFAATYVAQAALPDPAPMSADAEATIASRALSLVGNLLYAQQASVERPADVLNSDTRSVDTLKTVADAIGVTLGAVASSCRLDAALISKINARRIAVETIPDKLFARLSDALKATPEVLRACVSGTPRFTEGRAYLATAGPETAAPQSFADAIKASSLSAEDQAYWLDHDA